METFSALLAICAENSPVPGELPAQRPVTRSFDVSFDLRWVNNRDAGDLRRYRTHNDVTVMDECTKKWVWNIINIPYVVHSDIFWAFIKADILLVSNGFEGTERKANDSCQFSKISTSRTQTETA